MKWCSVRFGELAPRGCSAAAPLAGGRRGINDGRGNSFTFKKKNEKKGGGKKKEKELSVEPQTLKVDLSGAAELGASAASLMPVIPASPGPRAGLGPGKWQPAGREWQLDTALAGGRRLRSLTRARGRCSAGRNS